MRVAETVSDVSRRDIRTYKMANQNHTEKEPFDVKELSFRPAFAAGYLIGLVMPIQDRRGNFSKTFHQEANSLSPVPLLVPESERANKSK